MYTEIPTDFIAFLLWVKQTTEDFWSKDSETSEEDIVCEDWCYNAKWIGMTDAEIEAAERRHSITFTDYHKQFLKILHTLDKKEKVQNYDEEGNEVMVDRSFFYNWNTDYDTIQYYLNWPLDTFLFDIEHNNFWFSGWGNKPENQEEKETVIANWLKKAPLLIPLYAHRFIISDPTNTDNPVLSFMGLDTIVYGRTLRHYLLHELRDQLGLTEWVYDNEEGFYDEDVDEDSRWSLEESKLLSNIHDKEYNLLIYQDIPFWKDFLIENGFNNYLKG